MTSNDNSIGVRFTEDEIRDAVDWEWACNYVGFAEAFYEAGKGKSDLLTYVKRWPEDLETLMRCYCRECWRLN